MDIKSFDEEVLREYVTFSTSANIANVTSALLKSPAARWELEKKGIQYILLDHFEQKVSLTNDGRNNNDAIQYQHSSLSLLADALNNLAGNFICTEVLKFTSSVQHNISLLIYPDSCSFLVARR